MDSDSLKAFVEQLVALLDVAVDAVTVSGTHRTVVAITTPDSEKLIGKDGDTLRALNMVAKRLVEAKQEKGSAVSNFIIDVNGYQEAQLEGLRSNARMQAQRVRLFKHDAELEPMSAYERLVVHELFAEDSEIKTESAGEGKFRHIVLKYSSK